MTIYLAGAIRDTHLDVDVGWREYLITQLSQAYPTVRILNPLGNKIFNPKTKIWKVGSLVTHAKGIVQQDLWSVRQSDIVIANFTSLADRHPSIGTVMEVGAAVGMGGKLIYTILDPRFTGSPNPRTFKLHPFLFEAATETFESVKACWDFLRSHLGMLTGSQPRYGGLHGGQFSNQG